MFFQQAGRQRNLEGDRCEAGAFGFDGALQLLRKYHRGGTGLCNCCDAGGYSYAAKVYKALEGAGYVQGIFDQIRRDCD